MANDKMTIAKAMEYVIAVYGESLPTDVLEKCQSIKAQAQKKSKAEKLPTAEQLENAKLRDEITEYLRGVDTPKTCSEISNHFGVSIHKASALLTQLVKAETVVRTEEKRKAYFSIAQ